MVVPADQIKDDERLNPNQGDYRLSEAVVVFFVDGLQTMYMEAIAVYVKRSVLIAIDCSLVL